MLILLLFILFISIFLASFYILSSLFKTPRAKIFKKKSKIKIQGQFDIWTINLTEKLEKVIRLSPFFENELEDKLELVSFPYTAKYYIAKCISYSWIYYAFSIIIVLISPLTALITFSIGVYFSIKEYRKVNIALGDKKEHIERELPRFLSFVIQVFTSNQDIRLALTNYEKIAKPYFKKEINITLADMQTGNYERALLRLDKRVNSSELSKIIRALLSVLRGDDSIVYLKQLLKESQNKEAEVLKLKALTTPAKVKRYSMFIFMYMVFIFLAVIVLQIVDVIRGAF